MPDKSVHLLPTTTDSSYYALVVEPITGAGYKMQVSAWPSEGGSNWTVTGSDIYRVSKVGLGGSITSGDVAGSELVVKGTNPSAKFIRTSGANYLGVDSGNHDAGFLFFANGIDKWWTYNEQTSSDYVIFGSAASIRVKHNNSSTQILSTLTEVANIKIGNASSTGYVWTATDNLGNGSWQAAAGSGVTINNNADNRIITASGTAGVINAETQFTYNGTTLAITTPNTTGLKFQEFNANVYGMWAYGVTPDSTNYGLVVRKDATELGLNALTYVGIGIGGTDMLTVTSGLVEVADLKIGTSSTVGHVWTATDTGGNGSWQASVADYYVTPEDYGAVGDNSTNDTTAVQNAINSGKPVLLKSMYRVTALTAPAGTHIFGLNNSTCGLSSVTNSAVFTITGSYLRFEGFRIVGNTAGSSQHGFKFDNTNPATDPAIKNIVVKDMFLSTLYSGLYSANNLGTFRDSGYIASNNFIQSCTRGIWCDTSGEYNVFADNRISLCTVGFYNDAGNNSMVGGSIVGCTTGVYLGGGTNNAHSLVSGTTINHSSLYSIHADGVLYGHLFSGCVIYSGVDAGDILIEDSNGIQIEGGSISNNDITITNSTHTKIAGVSFKDPFTVTQTGSKVSWHGNKFESAVPTGIDDSGIDSFFGIRNRNDNTFSILNMFNASTDPTTYRNVISSQSSRGTHASPSANVSADQLFSITATGHDGSAFQTKASMDFKVDGTVSSGVVPMSWSVSTSSTSSGRAERLKVASNGDIIISGLAGSGSGVVAVDNNGKLSWTSAGGGGSPTLNQYQIGVGNGSNVLSGSSAFTNNGGNIAITDAAASISMTVTGHGGIFSDLAGDIYAGISSGVGMHIDGYSKDGTKPGFRMQSYSGGTTVTEAPFVFEAYKWSGSGTTLAAVGNAEPLWDIYNGVNFLSGTPIFQLLGDGTLKLTKYAGSGSGYLAVDNNGTVSWGSETDPLSIKLTGTSTLTGSITIAGGASNKVNITGSGSEMFKITQSGTGFYGMDIDSLEYGANIIANTVPLNLQNDNTNTNAIRTMATYYRNGANGANGIGMSFQYYIRSSTGSTPQAAEEQVLLTNATNGSETAAISWSLKYNGGGSLAEVMRLNGNGSMTLFNGSAAPSASVTNAVILYAEDVAASAELKVRDEAGNITTLSPHNFSGIPDGPSENMAWAHYSEKDGEYINVDMLKLARIVEKEFGVKLVYTGKK